MNLSKEFQPIRDWANNKGIIEHGNVFRQYTKFQEEAGELAKALIKENKEEAIDAIGDIVVTLVSLAGILARVSEDDTITIEKCINDAYNVIKNRTGKLVDGDFIKSETRPCENCSGDGFIDLGAKLKDCETCSGTGQIKQ